MKRNTSQKRVLLSSMLAIALALGGSVTAFAAEDASTSFGYLAGQQQNSDRHAQHVAAGSSDAESEAYKAAQGIVGEKYSDAQHLDTEALVEAGAIDQATADRIKEYASAKHDAIHARYDSMADMTDDERHAYYATVKSDGSSGDTVDELLSAGLITQEQADAINAYLG